MTKRNDYYDKLRTLPGDLLAALQSDYLGKKELFSVDEYRSPEFHEALLLLLGPGKDASYFPSEITSFVQTLLGPGRILSLYCFLGEFLYQCRGGIGVERLPHDAKWAEFLLKIAEIEASVITEDPLHWEPKRKFEPLLSKLAEDPARRR
jgi:hypothetical protein